MRKILAVSVGVLVLSGLLTATGCVSKAEYNKALDLNRKAQHELASQRAKTRQLQSDKTTLMGELTQAEADAQKAVETITLLKAARKKLHDDYDTLLALYRESREGPGPPPQGLVLPVQVDKALRDFAEANPGLVEYRAKHGMIKIKSDLTFALGSTQIKADAAEALTKLVEIINDPAVAAFHVYIAGHTDNVPVSRPSTRRSHPNNWYLSVHRAVAVQKLMVIASLAPERIGAMGFGEYHPVAPNKTGKSGKKLGNQANRRVEIWIVPPSRFLTSGEMAAADESDEK
ncbi:MAG: OmpA family protein [Phycisphaerae bacterium]|jgi:chemotaxis protein MotB|nr:OmpA family protein [Phycisphaerae bacterium]MDP7635944.1 OmpA family protein [Phycisphaerae bacterium]